MAEELLINVNVQGEEQIPKIDENLNKINNTAGKTKDAFQKMRQEAKQAKADMLSAAEGSDKYNDALKRAAASADKMRDMNDKIKASQRDIGVVAKNVTGVISGMAGAFSTAQGIIGLFGVESDNVTKSILKVTQIMQVTSGIAQFADSFDSMKDIFLAVKLRIIEMVKAKAADTIVTNVNTGAQIANAAAIEGVGTAATLSSKAVMKALGPYALIAAAIAALVYGVTKLIEKINEVPEEVKLDIKLNEEVNREMTSLYNKIIKFAYDYNEAVASGDRERIARLKKIGSEEYGLHTNQLKMISETKDGWRNAFADYLEIAKQSYKNEFAIKNLAEAEMKAETESQFDIDYEIAVTALKKRDQAVSELLKSGVSQEVIDKLISGELKWIGRKYDVSVKKLQTEQKYYNMFKDLAQKDAEKASKILSDAKYYFDRTYKPIKELPGTTGTPGTPNPETKETPLTVKQFKPTETPNLSEASPFVQQAILDKKALVKTEDEIVQSKKDFNKKIDKINEEGNTFFGSRGTSVVTKRMEQISNERNLSKQELAIAQKTYDDLKSNYDNKIKLHNENITNTNFLYVGELGILRSYEAKKFDIEQQIKNAEEEFNNAKTDSDRNTINIKLQNLNKELEINNKKLESQKKVVEDLQAKKKNLEDITNDLSKTPDEIAAAKDKIVEINNQIANSTADMAQAVGDHWANMAQDALKYLDTLQGLTDGLGQYYQARQAEIDSETEGYKDIVEGNRISKKEEEKLRKNDLKTYKAAQKAKNGTDADRAKFIYELEMSAWEQKVKLFEKQKNAQKASAWINFASGTVAAWAGAFETFKNPVVAAVVGAVETAGLLATTLAQIKTIDSQRLDAPSEGNASSPSSSSAASFAALMPTQTTMTTSQENLNLMASGTKEENVVRVSDINETQKIVKIRENNTSY